MTCSDADRLWDDVLDARGAGDPVRERLIEAHASGCPRCRASAARFGALRAAIAALPPPPGPSDGLGGRFLAASRSIPARPAVAATSPRAWLALATAASLLAVAWSGTRAPGPRPEAKRPEVRLELASALAGAASATIDLARGVSGPAARIGRDVLDFDGEEFAQAARIPGADKQTGSAPDLLRSVGARIDAGARPLSGSARHAFGFLLPQGSDADPSPLPDDDDGA